VSSRDYAAKGWKRNLLSRCSASNVTICPPSADQLAYSTELSRQQVTQVQAVLRSPDFAQPPYGNTPYS
jgi:hypothetical protein